ncbi:MAG: hypothetical protein R3281_18635 [Balneolaceae bacterium]|nr:hypothetical protein [Balneolaceae bacterium]
MNWLTQEEAETLVTACLSEIADWSGDPGEFELRTIPDQHKISFMKCIQEKMNDRDLHIDLSLNDPISGINNMERIIDLINYLYNNQAEL